MQSGADGDCSGNGGGGVWVEKHRPRALSAVVGQQTVVAMGRRMIGLGILPCLLLSGPCGVGKTSVAIALSTDFFSALLTRHGIADPELRSLVAARCYCEINASDDRGAATVAAAIDAAVDTPLPGNVNVGVARLIPRVVLMDEADNLTAAAHEVLCQRMDRYRDRLSLILTCNDSTKLPPRLQSRLTVVRMDALAPDAVMSALRRVRDEEKLDRSVFGDSALEFVRSISHGDLRTALVHLESAASSPLAQRSPGGDGAMRTEAAPGIADFLDLPPVPTVRALLEQCMRDDLDGALATLSSLLALGHQTDDFLHHLGTLGRLMLRSSDVPEVETPSAAAALLRQGDGQAQLLLDYSVRSALEDKAAGPPKGSTPRTRELVPRSGPGVVPTLRAPAAWIAHWLACLATTRQRAEEGLVSRIQLTGMVARMCRGRPA